MAPHVPDRLSWLVDPLEGTVSRAVADHGFTSSAVRSPTDPALLCLTGSVGKAR